MPIYSLMGLAVVVMVVRGETSGGGGLNEGSGGGRGKIGWVEIGVGEGGMGTRGRVRLAES